MDPVSIGLAVAAVAGASAAEGFANQVGIDAWQAVQRMLGAVRARLTPGGAAALDRLTAGDGGAGGGSGVDAEVIAGEVHTTVVADPVFRAEVADLLDQAVGNQKLATVIAVAQDNAKQINIGGDNHGPMTFN
ncbi:hypothetical protein O7623_27540 [Solwaraspora sp. WMMD791]|uniref:hypothetical protein n=1 Tax=Solwaraspora sp. WMMD791 TaxID=3016086 RepID=UPI00249ADE24|nr:hypothetical protein [Solwaraspora sp. WMMD791]WFE26976.1 hypothetical protein O7623_27540 [Solwaraspora sp. WMMD791]